VNTTKTSEQANSQVQAQSVSSSRLGVYVMQASSGGLNIIQSGPKVFQAFDPQKIPGILQLVRDYKQLYPDGIVVMHVYDGTQNLTYKHTTHDPVASATDYWQKALLPAISLLSAADRQLFDYLSGPNEYSCTPPLNSAAETEWVCQFWVTLADLISQAGFRPNLGEIPVGNPDIGKLAEIMPPLVPALRHIKSLGGCWSYHGYTLQYTTDPGVEVWYSLRYRQLYTYLEKNYPDLSDMPMILTEAGVDERGDPTTSGWKARGDAAKYKNWLTWFDRELKLDPYIIGAAIFQVGDTYWSSFNIEEISDWLAGYLKGTTVTSFSPVADTHVYSGSANSKYGSSATITVQGGSKAYNGYLKFNVAGLSGTVRSAKLRLYVTDPSPNGGSVYSVSNFYKNSTTSWTESGLTWKNAPPISGTPLASAGSAASGYWKEFPVTAVVTRDGTYSFGITSSHTDAVNYSSKEGANKPQLIVETRL